MEKWASKVLAGGGGSGGVGGGTTQVKSLSGSKTTRAKATKKVVSYFVWPVGFSLGCFIAYYVSYEMYLEFQMALGLQFLLCAVLIHLFERWMPHEERWLVSDGEEKCDCSYVLSAAVLEQFASAMIGTVVGPLCEHVWGERSERVWAFTPLVVQIVFALLISEIGSYSSHRLFHVQTLPFWRFHAIHHCTSRICWINCVHNHPLDMLKKVGSLLPFFLND